MTSLIRTKNSLLLPVVFGWVSFFAQPPSDRQIIHYGVEDGLSQGSVYSMLRDSRDFLWFTSYDGLNRFDGRHFRVYYPQAGDSTSLRGSRTVGLVEDLSGAGILTTP